MQSSSFILDPFERRRKGHTPRGSYQFQQAPVSNKQHTTVAKHPSSGSGQLLKSLQHLKSFLPRGATKAVPGGSPSGPGAPGASPSLLLGGANNPNNPDMEQFQADLLYLNLKGVQITKLPRKGKSRKTVLWVRRVPLKVLAALQEAAEKAKADKAGAASASRGEGSPDSPPGWGRPEYMLVWYRSFFRGLRQKTKCMVLTSPMDLVLRQSAQQPPGQHLKAEHRVVVSTCARPLEFICNHQEDFDLLSRVLTQIAGSEHVGPSHCLSPR
jgi:hypothetical protein